MFDIDPKKFGERLRDAIKLANTTQKDLADKIGVTKTAVNNYVGGRIPDATILYKICKSLNISMEWLLDGEDQKQTNVVFDKEEFDLITLYNKCDENQKEDVLEKIKSYLLAPDYNFERSISTLSEDEVKIIELFRRLNTKDKIKIEGIIESKLMDAKEFKRGTSFNYPSGEDAATLEELA